MHILYIESGHGWQCLTPIQWFVWDVEQCWPMGMENRGEITPPIE